MYKYTCLILGLLFGTFLNAAPIIKLVQTHGVKSISPAFTDAQCQTIIPKSYSISVGKGLTVSGDIAISQYLTLRDDHELIPDSETSVGQGNKVFIFTALLRYPTGQAVHALTGVSFFKIAPDKTAQGLFIIDGLCEAHFIRAA